MQELISSETSSCVGGERFTIEIVAYIQDFD